MARSRDADPAHVKYCLTRCYGLSGETFFLSLPAVEMVEGIELAGSRERAWSYRHCSRGRF